ncbi:MAG: hypothetical protein J5501_06155 [Ruminococcus sp.]|nr:hypothetical protein [Ruminococcus sp.]
MQREIRRCRDHLVSIGTGVSLFGIWTVIRIIMGFILEREYVMEEIQKGTDEDQRLVIAVLCFLIAVFLLMILGIHLYIGMSARREGLGGKKGNGYLIVTALFILFYCFGITAEIVLYDKAFKGISDGIVTVFIDITMLVTLAELMFNAVRVRKLSRQLTETGCENAG